MTKLATLNQPVRANSCEIARILTPTGALAQLRDGTWLVKRSDERSFVRIVPSSDDFVYFAQVQRLARRYRRTTFIFRGRVHHTSPFA